MRIQSINLTYESFTRPIRAAVFGDWACHRNTNGDGYRVSHVPTGRCIKELADELDAMDALAIAQAFDESGVPLDYMTEYEAQAIVAKALDA